MIWKYLLAACLMMCAAGSAFAQAPLCPVPYILQNGTIADASQVMANFNTLSTCISNVGGGAAAPETFKLATDPDDTNSIQAALNTCRNVQLSSFHTYHVSKPLYLCSGGHQSVFGGGASSVVQLSSTWVGTTACADPNGSHWTIVFANPNCGGATATNGGGTFTDTYISFRDFRIDATLNAGAQLTGIGIFARNVQFLYVHDITCDHFADCTAFLGSSDTLVDDSLAVSSFNAGFDHWDSPFNASAVNDTVYCAASGNYGFLYNASDTNSSHDGVAVNYYNINGKSFGCGNAIFIDPLTAGGLVQNITLIGFLADAAAQSKGGILVTGNVQQGQIVAPVARDFTDVGGNGAIYIGPSPVAGTSKPRGLNITSPQFINVTVSSGNVAPLRVLGSPTTRVTGANYTNVTAPYAVDVDATGTYLDGTYPVGSTGLVNTHGSFPDFHNQNYTSTTVTSCGSGAAFGGVSTKTTVTVGTSGITSCQVNFPSGAWAYAPSCVVTPFTAGDQLAVASTTTAAAVVTSAASMSGHLFTLLCIQ